MKRIVMAARRRLRADAKDTLIRQVERVLTKHGIRRLPSKYPREYVKDIETPEDGRALRTDLEHMGFTFQDTPFHGEDHRIASEGEYMEMDYIIDIVYQDKELKVELYH